MSIMRRMFRLPLLLLLLAFSANTPVAATEGKNTLRLNVSPQGYPPFLIVQQDGSFSGIVWDIFSAIASRQGYVVEGLEIPRKRVDDFILSGHIDATPRAIEWTAEPERFLFTEPLLQVEEVFFMREGTEFEFTGPESLIGKNVVTHLGYKYPTLKPVFASGKAERFDVQNERDMLRYLIDGRQYDLGIAVLQVGLWHIRQEQWQDKLDYAPQPLSSQGYRLMFAKERGEFVQLFNRELEAMKANGEWDEILNRYR